MLEIEGTPRNPKEPQRPQEPPKVLLHFFRFQKFPKVRGVRRTFENVKKSKSTFMAFMASKVYPHFQQVLPQSLPSQYVCIMNYGIRVCVGSRGNPRELCQEPQGIPRNPKNPQKYFCIFSDFKSSPRSEEFSELLKTSKNQKVHSWDPRYTHISNRSSPKSLPFSIHLHHELGGLRHVLEVEGIPRHFSRIP